MTRSPSRISSIVLVPYNNWGFNTLGTMSEGNPVAEGVGSAGFYISGYGGHALVVVPKLQLVYVLRLNTDGSFDTPEEAGRLFRMIRDARAGLSGSRPTAPKGSGPNGAHG